jgi:hypothetical protein
MTLHSLGGEELYGETKDPSEWTNLADDRKYGKLKAELSNAFSKVNRPRGAAAKGKPEDNEMPPIFSRELVAPFLVPRGRFRPNQTQRDLHHGG